VLREVREELGLDGEVESLVGAYGFEQRNELIVAYHVRARGEVRLGEELEAFKRVPIEKLRPWPFGTGHAVRDWLARRAAQR
ncbi:MAG TPA: NUDIX domain-containing protein, partial [Sandaracinaceae bacterium]